LTYLYQGLARAAGFMETNRRETGVGGSAVGHEAAES